MTRFPFDDILALHEPQPHRISDHILPLIVTPEALRFLTGQIDLDILTAGHFPDLVILTISPPIRHHSLRDVLRERNGLPSIADLVSLRYADPFMLDEPGLCDCVALPPRERPTGKGRTAIPDTGSRRAELAARADRLRRKTERRAGR